MESSAGWKEIRPRSLPDRRLFFEENQRLLSIATDFTSQRDFGFVGQSPCPLATDPESGLLYRHTSEHRLFKKDFSRIQSFNPITGRRETLMEIPVTRWACWMLDRIPGHHALLGHFGVDRSFSTEVVIDYQLGLIDIPSNTLRFAQLPPDAVFPLTISFRQGLIAFRGWDGISLTNLRGRLMYRLNSLEDAMGRGATIHPSEPWIVIGGGGLHLWNWKTGNLRQLCNFGQHPQWCREGKGIWFSRSSSDLWWLPSLDADPICILKAQKDRLEEISPERHFVLSPDGNYIALQATWKKIIGVSSKGLGGRSAEQGDTRQNLKTIQQKSLNILDLNSKAFWSAPVGGSNLAWI